MAQETGSGMPREQWPAVRAGPAGDQVGPVDRGHLEAVEERIHTENLAAARM